MDNTFQEATNKFTTAVQPLHSQKLADLLVEAYMTYKFKHFLTNKGYVPNSSLSNPLTLMPLLASFFSQSSNQHFQNIYKKSSYSSWSGNLRLLSKIL